MAFHTSFKFIAMCGGVITAAAVAPWLAAAADLAPVDVRVEGVHGELKENVLNTLTIAQRGKQRLSESEVRDLDEHAEKEIVTALQPFGYYHPVITRRLDHDQGHWVAEYRIELGPPLLVDSLDVRVSGDGGRDRVFQRLLERFPIHRGDVLVHSVYENAKNDFMTAAMRHGYLDARFDRHELLVDLPSYTCIVVMNLDTGPQYVFGPVQFNQQVVNDDILQGYVNFREGEPLDFNHLIEMEQALGNSPYWSRVEVRPRRDLAEGNRLPISVDLTPSKRQKFTGGLGYGTDNGAHVRTILELRRMNRRGHRGQIDFTVSRVERSGTAKYEIPWPYPRTDVLTFSTGYSTIRTVSSDEETWLLGTGLARIWAGWHETFALNYKREKFTVGLDQGLENFLVPEASWNRLRTNNPIDPRSGTRVVFQLSAANRSLLSAASYERVAARAKWLKAVAGRNRVIGRVEGGATWTSDFHRLPPEARFFAGGSESVRGFAFNSLGPRDASGHVTGGRGLMTASLEYEYRFMPRWGVATFYDVGNAVNGFSDKLEQGTGAGARWVSPIGLVKVDLGVPLTKNRKHLELHIAIGPGL